MKTGRPMRPKAQKELEGTMRSNSRDRDVDDSFVPLEAPLPTNRLSADQQKRFERAVEASLMLRSSFRGDAEIMTRYAQLGAAFSEAAEALHVRQLSTGSMVVENASGMPGVAPELTMMLRISTEMRQIEQHLGFSPATRTKVLGTATKALADIAETGEPKSIKDLLS